MFSSMNRRGVRVFGVHTGSERSVGRVVSAGVLGVAVLVGSSGCNNAIRGRAERGRAWRSGGHGHRQPERRHGQGCGPRHIAGGLGGAILGDQNQRSSRSWGRSSRCD